MNFDVCSALDDYHHGWLVIQADDKIIYCLDRKMTGTLPIGPLKAGMQDSSLDAAQIDSRFCGHIEALKTDSLFTTFKPVSVSHLVDDKPVFHLLECSVLKFASKVILG